VLKRVVRGESQLYVAQTVKTPGVRVVWSNAALQLVHNQEARVALIPSIAPQHQRTNALQMLVVSETAPLASAQMFAKAFCISVDHQQKDVSWKPGI